MTWVPVLRFLQLTAGAVVEAQAQAQAGRPSYESISSSSISRRSRSSARRR